MTWGTVLAVLALLVSIATAVFVWRGARTAERANHLSRLNILFALKIYYQAQFQHQGELAKSLANMVGGREAEKACGELDTKLREVTREIDKYHTQVICMHD